MPHTNMTNKPTNNTNNNSRNMYMSPQITEPDEYDATTPRAYSLAQMRRSLRDGVPAPPVDHSPTVPSRGSTRAVGRSRSCRVEVAEVEGNTRRITRRGSLTFAGSVNDLKRAGCSRRSSATESEFGESFSSFFNSSSQSFHGESSDGDLGSSVSALGLSFSTFQLEESEERPKHRSTPCRSASIY
jgi:hypothetical protein